MPARRRTHPSLPDLPQDLEIGYAIARLGRLLARDAARSVARDVGLNLAEWRLLLVVDDARDRQFDSLADLALLEKSHASLASRALLGRKLIEQRPDPADRRRVLLRRLPAGRALVHRYLRGSAESRRGLWAVLTTREAAAMRAGLFKLLDRIECNPPAEHAADSAGPRPGESPIGARPARRAAGLVRAARPRSPRSRS